MGNLLVIRLAVIPSFTPSPFSPQLALASQPRPLSLRQLQPLRVISEYGLHFKKRVSQVRNLLNSYIDQKIMHKFKILAL